MHFQMHYIIYIQNRKTDISDITDIIGTRLDLMVDGGGGQ